MYILHCLQFLIFSQTCMKHLYKSTTNQMWSSWAHFEFIFHSQCHSWRLKMFRVKFVFQLLQHPLPYFPLFIRGLKFKFKKSFNGGSWFSYKMEWGISIEWKGATRCFSLIIDVFCSNNAHYSRFLFAMFVFLLAPFDTRYCYYLEWNLSQVLLI